MQVRAKRQVVQWINGPDKTGSNGIGDEDLDVKPGEGESVGKRGAPQLDVQELKLEHPQDPDKRTQKESPGPEGVTREAPPDPEEGTQEALPDPEEETREAPLDAGQEKREVPLNRKEETQEAPLYPDEETREAPSNPNEQTGETPSNPEKGTQKALSDSEEETEDVGGLAAGSTDLEEMVVPARRKLTISDNRPPNNVIRHVDLTGARRRERSNAAICRRTRKATRRVCRCATAGAR